MYVYPLPRHRLKLRQVSEHAPGEVHTLAFYAEQLGLTDAHLAEITGLHIGTFGDWWRGRYRASPDSLDCVAAALDLRVRLMPTKAYYERIKTNREFNL